MGSNKHIFIRFAEYQGYSEMKKNSKVVNTSIRFLEEELQRHSTETSFW